MRTLLRRDLIIGWERGLASWSDRARRTADNVPLTARGALVAILSAAALWHYGYGALDLVVFALAGAGLALTLLAALSVGGAALRLRRTGGAEIVALGRVEAGARVCSGFSLPSLARWPLLQLDWRWIRPEGVDCRVRSGRERADEEVVAHRRGEAPEIRRRFVLRDAFGLAAVSWERSQPGALWIVPEVGGLRRVSLLHSLAGGEGIPHPAGAPEGDRMEIRRYVSGDSPRHILWKAYARTGQLNVRTPERSLERARRTLAYLVAGPDDEAAAAAARVALEGGALGPDWIFGADGTEEPAEDLESALRAIARSGAPRWRERGGAGLPAFLGAAACQAADPASCVVFAPGRPGPWTDPVLTVARKREGRLSFVLGTDGLLPPAAARPLWHQVLFAPTPPEPGVGAVPADEHSLLLRRLGEVGVAVHVVDRTTGRSFPPAYQRALRMSA